MTHMAKFYVPEYYDHFRCKGGACRRTCCRGWNITLSMREYFALRSVEGSESLNRRMDGALEIISDDKERYAAFVRTQDGSCPLLREDGLCAMHAECGEDMLPAVCREYPRAYRTDYACELAFSASCESFLRSQRILLASTSLPISDRISAFRKERTAASGYSELFFIRS